VNPALLTLVATVVVPVIAVIVMPFLSKRQTARLLREAAEREQIKEDARRDAQAAEGEVVSWEKINQRLTVTAQEERAAHQMRLAELRESFAEEVQRTKRQTDYEMDRAKQEIHRLSDRVDELTRQILSYQPKP
jgi:type II secretory pathway pseudopilin PulG